MGKKNTCMIGTALILLGTAVAQGQSRHPAGSAQQSTRKTTGMNIAPDTPALRATMIEMGRLDKEAAVALDTGDYATVEAAARRSVSLGVGSGLGQELLASALYAQGKTDEALRAYQVMAKQGDDAPRNLLPYALLLLKKRHWPEAVAVYNKALPRLSDGALMVANSHFSPRVFQPRQLATAIHIALGLTYGYADSWGRHSQEDKALAELRQALSLTPDSALAYLYYGHQLKRVGHGVEAQAAFVKAAEVGRGDVKAAAELAQRRR